MADPGGVVGAVSLALQLAKGLKIYYSNFKSFHDDIATTVLRIERLESSLRLIERPIQQLARDDDPILEHAWTSIADCLRALQRMKLFQEKCSKPKYNPDKLKQKAQDIQDRLAFPFRKSALADLHADLDTLSENLQLVTQILHLDTTVLHNDQAEKRDQLTQAQLSHLQIHQEGQTDILKSVDVRMQSQIDTAITMDDRATERDQHTHAGLTDIRAHQRYQTKLIESVDVHLQKHAETSLVLQSHVEDNHGFTNSQLSEIQAEQKRQTDLLQYVAALVQQDMQTQASQALGSAASTAPGFIIVRGTSNESMHGSTVCSTSPRHSRGVSAADNGVAVFQEFFCRCPKSSISPATRRILAGRATYSRSTSYRHRPHCPYYTPAQNSTTIAVKFFLRKIGYRVEGAIRWGAGSVSPHIIFRNTVSWKSPAFSLLGALGKFMDLYRLKRIGLSADAEVKVISDLLDLTLKCLSQLFRDKRAGPFDQLENGRTLFHSIMNALIQSPHWQSDQTIPSFVQHLNRFLKIVGSWGVPKNELDDLGLTPLDYLLDGPATTGMLSTGVLEVSELSGMQWTSHIEASHGLYQIHMVLRRLETFSRWSKRHNSTDEYTGDPLILSILQQSVADLQHGLRHYYSPDQQPFLLHYACTWPEGLCIILGHQVPTDTLIGDCSPLDWALGFKAEGQSFNNHAAVAILEKSAAPTTESTWFLALNTEDITVIQAIASRIRRDTVIANVATKGNCPTLYDGILWTSAWLERNPIQCAQFAQVVWEAGHKATDVNADCAHWNHMLGTTLWKCSWSLLREVYNEWSYPKKGQFYDSVDPNFWTIFEYSQWLIGHGANVSVPHPIGRSMPVHLFAESMVYIHLLQAESRKASIGGVLEEEISESEEPEDGEGIKEEGMKHIVDEEEGGDCIENGDCSGAGSWTGMGTNQDRVRFGDFHRDIFQNTDRDECECACSEIGCEVITVVWNTTKTMPREPGNQRRVMLETELEILTVLLDELPSIFESDRPCKLLFRVMTFGRLGLTHSCHVYTVLDPCSWDYPSPLPTKEEVAMIQSVERDELALLDKLLLKLNAAWEGYPGTILEFIKTVWSPLMEEVRVQRWEPEPSISEEVERLQDLGIVGVHVDDGVVDPIGPVTHEQARDCPEDGSVEWFEWIVKRIMAGEDVIDSLGVLY